MFLSMQKVTIDYQLFISAYSYKILYINFIQLNFYLQV